MPILHSGRPTSLVSSLDGSSADWDATTARKNALTLTDPPHARLRSTLPDVETPDGGRWVSKPELSRL